jgi:hypothetical protein
MAQNEYLPFDLLMISLSVYATETETR